MGGIMAAVPEERRPRPARRRAANGNGPGEKPTKSARSRQRILDAAARVFREQGYATARLSDIAEAAGMQTGSLYYHFDSREALVDEVLALGITTAWGHVREAIDALPEDASPLDRLATAIRAQIAAVLEISDYASAQVRIVGQVPRDVYRRHVSDQNRYGAYWNEMIEAAIASGDLRDDLDPYVVRMLLFGAMNWTAEWYRPRRGSSPEVIGDQAVEMVLQGLGRVPARTRPARGTRR